MSCKHGDWVQYNTLEINLIKCKNNINLDFTQLGDKDND